MESTVTLTEGMAFEAQVDGHTVVIDAKAEHGGRDAGPAPKTLVLTGLAGCAAMDIISILRKMRAAPDTLSVTAESELTDEHPKVFAEPVVTVRATGDVPTKKLWRAVALSRDRYCGVAAMLRAHAPIRYVVELNGEAIPEPPSDG